MNIFIKLLALTILFIVSINYGQPISYLMFIPKEIRAEIIGKLIQEYKTLRIAFKDEEAKKLYADLQNISHVNKEFKNLLFGNTSTAKKLFEVKKDREKKYNLFMSAAAALLV